MAFPPDGPNGLGVEISLLESNREKTWFPSIIGQLLRQWSVWDLRFLEKFAEQIHLAPQNLGGQEGHHPFSDPGGCEDGKSRVC